MKRILTFLLACLMLFAIVMMPAIQPQAEVQALGTAHPVLAVQKLPQVLSTASSSVDLVRTTKKPAPPPAPDAANKWAVVIGIADYLGSGNDLWHPDEDASEMASALINNYGFASDHVKILLNRKATASAILSAISWLVASEDSGSTVVFFYSGHGFRAADSENWDNDNESDGYDEGIVSYDIYGLPDGLLKSRLSGLESAKVAILFGSCHSGGLFDDNDDLQGSGRIIAAACKADQYGWDYLQLGNTLWGKYFVDLGILNKQAETNSDGASIEEAHVFAYPRVTAVQADSQPQLSDQFSGEFIP